jgi:hypothetical protein
MGGLLYFSYLPGIYEDRRWPRPGWLQVFVFLLCTFHTYPSYTMTGIGRVRAGCRVVFLPALFLLLPWFFCFFIFALLTPGWLQGALGFGFCFCYPFGFFLIFFVFTHPGLVAGPWGHGFCLLPPRFFFKFFLVYSLRTGLQDIGDMSVSLDPKEWSNSLR